MILYHDIPVQVTGSFVNKFNSETCVKISTADENRWSNGWIRASDLVFTEGESLESVLKRRST